MFMEHRYTVWGTKCRCGEECSILQNEHHPWDKTSFSVKIPCNKCGKTVLISQRDAEEHYNQKMLKKYEGVYGEVMDMGCGGGFLTRYLLQQEEVSRIMAVDSEAECYEELEDILKNEKVAFINEDADNLENIFPEKSVDFLVHRDVFMFLKDTEKYFDITAKLVKREIRHMGWFIGTNKRMKNRLHPYDIVSEYRKRGWKVDVEYLDWYKSGYFIRAYRGEK